jgi:hypothetical protein
MRKNKLKLKICGKLLSIVILMSFLRFPMFAEPLTEQTLNLSGNETRLYSDLEVGTLIDEVSEAAYKAIEQAAAEAARAAALAALEREMTAIREANRQQAEALRWQMEAEQQTQAVTNARKTGIKNTIIAGLVCLLGGLAIGIAINR